MAVYKMFFRLNFLLFNFLVVYSCSNGHVRTGDFDNNRHIVIIGNTFAERIQYYNYFEPLLYNSFPKGNLIVRNLGWSGDEIDGGSRPLNFPTQDELLYRNKADIIIACYGMNESFDGRDSLLPFEWKLTNFLNHLKNQKYNGKSSPEIILVSPIAHEKKSGMRLQSESHNADLLLYVEKMREVSTALDISFVDLWTPTLAYDSSAEDITINGIHLNDRGYRMASEIMAKSLGFLKWKWEDDPNLLNLKKIIDHKNQQFFYYYRAVNWEYIAGRRKEPWVQPPGGPVSYPSELNKLEGMVKKLDSLVWKQSLQDDALNIIAADHIINDTIQFIPLDRQSVVPPSLDQFVLPEGFEINLFASEADFSLYNPVKMTFDPDGRLWVSVMPSYPQYLPGAPPNDKILILEDTDGDGVADKETIFAEDLYLPMSFELGKGGVFVSQPPNIRFFKDTDGDDIADEEEILLHGFGTEDVHHTLSTYTWGPDGALYWHSGTFLHSQIETPYGLQRCDYGATWRYEPLTQKLEPYISYPYANPWGHVFNRTGMEIVSDVSTGMNYFAPPLTVATSYPKKLSPMKDFLTSEGKPKTCGTEIISSRHFPDEMQGNILLNIFLGVTGIHQHQIRNEGSGITAEETEPLLKSKDPYFRPVDLQFGPDGALYVLDWYNLIINHGERALRDSLRDHTHGRIWRITYKHKDLLKPIKLSELSIYDLLELLKEKEDRLRYRIRTQLRQYDAGEVIPVLEKWLSGLNTEDPDYDRNRLEGLWIFQQLNIQNESLLESLLKSRDAEIRTAGIRVLFYWRDRMDRVEERLAELSKDESAEVRLQALISLSHFDNEGALNAFLEALDDPFDYYIDYVIKESLRRLSPLWWHKFMTDSDFLADDPAKAQYLIGILADEGELKMPGFMTDDPEWKKYTWTAIKPEDLKGLRNGEILVELFEKDITEQKAVSEVAMGKLLISNSDCSVCHKIKEVVVGPSYEQIARKYMIEKDIIPKLVDKIIEGGSGVWGESIMTPHPELSREETKLMVKYILANSEL